MTLKKKLKPVQRAIARNAMYFFVWLFDHLPYCLVRGISRVMIRIIFIFTVQQKKIAYESINIAFGQEKTPQEINQIVRKCFSNIGRGMVELFYFMSHPALATAKVSFEGLENLDKALAHGKGVIAVTAHFGNFPLMMLSLARRGYATNTIMRPARDSEMAAFLEKKQRKGGLKPIYAIPRQRCVSESLKVLRNNELLFILMDQHFGGDGGVYVDFFGQKAATGTGPLVFSQRTGALMVPMFMVRQGDDDHKVIIAEPLAFEEKETTEATMVHNMTRITQVIEKYIRQYPHEWAWMHRRWKEKSKV